MARVEKGYRMAIVRSRDPLTLEVVPDVTVVSFQAAEALVRNQGGCGCRVHGQEACQGRRDAHGGNQGKESAAKLTQGRHCLLAKGKSAFLQGVSHTLLITILPEIRDCIPRLTADEKSQLERNIRADGCREPLALWVGEEQGTVLLDGHNRLEICERHSIDYTTQEIQEITSISEARIWVIDNQFGRRNLNKFQRAELALKRKEVMAAQARERQREGGGDRKSEAYKGSVDPKSDQPIGRTLPKLAKIAGVATTRSTKSKSSRKPLTPEPLRPKSSRN